MSKITVIDPGTGAASSPAPGSELYFTKTDINAKLADKMDKQLADDQGIGFVATNQTTGDRFRIVLQPVADEQGARVTTLVELLT